MWSGSAGPHDHSVVFRRFSGSTIEKRALSIYPKNTVWIGSE